MTIIIYFFSQGIGGSGWVFSFHRCLDPTPYILYPYPPQKGAARIFYVDSAAAVLKLTKIVTRFFRRFHFQPFFLMRIYT